MSQFVCEPEPKIRFAREILWLSAGRLPLSSNHTGPWVVGIRPEYESQTWVFSFCPHNRKCALPVRLERDKWTTMLLFVKFKAILCVNVWCADKKNSLYCDPHASYLENSCVAKLTAGLLETCRQTGTPLSIYSRMEVSNTHPLITPTESRVVVLL